MFFVFLILLYNLALSFYDFNVIMCISNSRSYEETKQFVEFAKTYTRAVSDKFQKPKHFALLIHSNVTKRILNFTNNTTKVLETLDTVQYEYNVVTRPDLCFNESRTIKPPNDLPNIYLSLTDGVIKPKSFVLFTMGDKWNETIDEVLKKNIMQVAYTSKLEKERNNETIFALSGRDTQNQYKLDGDFTFTFDWIAEKIGKEFKLRFDYCTDSPPGLTCGKTDIGDICSSSCGENYLPKDGDSDPIITTCGDDGIWKPSDGCEIKRCSVSPVTEPIDNDPCIGTEINKNCTSLVCRPMFAPAKNAVTCIGHDEWNETVQCVELSDDQLCFIALQSYENTTTWSESCVTEEGRRDEDCTMNCKPGYERKTTKSLEDEIPNCVKCEDCELGFEWINMPTCYSRVCVNPNTYNSCEIKCEDGFGSLGMETETCVISKCPRKSLFPKTEGCFEEHKCLECVVLLESTTMIAHPVFFFVLLSFIITLVTTAILICSRGKKHDESTFQNTPMFFDTSNMEIIDPEIQVYK